MRILRPAAVTGAVLAASSVPLPVVVPGVDPDPAVYVPGTTYPIHGMVRVDGRRWRSRQDGNTGNAPESSPTWWADAGPVNRLAMFDQSLGTVTSAADEIVVTLAPTGYVDSVSLMDVDAQSVTVGVADSPFNATFPMLYPRAVSNMYEYRFEPFEQRRKLLVTGLPVGAGAQITITIRKPGGVASCAMCVPGMLRQWGGTEFGLTAGIKDYGIKEFDQWGGPALLEGAYSDRISLSVVVPNHLIDGLHRELSKYRSTPVVWIASDLFELTQVYGTFRDFSIVIPNAKKSKCSIEIEGFAR